MKFKHKIVAASSAILLLALSLISINQYFLVKNKVQDLVNTSVHEIIEGISNTVKAEMDGKTKLAELTTNLVENDVNLQSAAKVLANQTLKDDFILIGYGQQSSGKYVASDPSWDPGSGWDPRKRPWYKDAEQANQLIVTDPYADAVSKEILVSIGTPVKQNGQFFGAIFFDVSLAGLGKMINKVNLFDAGYAFMVTKSGSIISHPNTALNGKPMSSFIPSIAIKNDVQEVEIKGEPTLIMFKKVAGFDWYVGIALETDKAFSAVKELRNDSVIYSAIFIALGISALLFIINLLMKPLVLISDAMANVAKGNADLTVRLSATNDDEFATLANYFNQFTAMLQTLLSDIKNLGHEILHDAKKTANGATTANKAISNQLISLESLATATNEMAATSIEVANNAKKASDAVQQTDNAVIEGRKIVEKTTQSITSLSQQIEETVEVVNELETATTGIENILAVINGIAEQTNLLALNAAIEAARAGESGRGFAVVADEVRTLAQRTQEATTEIKTMTEQLQNSAGSAVNEMTLSKQIASETVKQAGSANQALIDIRSSIENIVALNIQISASASEQCHVIEEVNRNAIEIKDISNTVANEANSVNQTMQSQVTHISKQEDMLEQFKT